MGESVQRRDRAWGLSRMDVAGAFGDVGILLPIAIALISLNHMNPTAVFLLAGLAYIVAGAYFRIPMAVEPFKAVAAISLALHLAPSAIASAGFLMGVLLFAIGATNVVGPLARLFSLPIIRGIQLGLGLILAREGLRLALGPGAGLDLGARFGMSGRFVLAGWMVALMGAVLLVALRDSRRLPSALVLLGAGLLLGLAARSASHPSALNGFSAGPLPLHLLRLNLGECRSVLTVLVLPQFALTFGNSIVATENTARILYGPQARRVTARALSTSIGLMNLLSGAILAAPTCHGSGGITAHYKFGARSQKSSYVIGGLCLLLALTGKSCVALLSLVPMAILGVFLLYVGLQHALFLRDIVAHKRLCVIAVTTGLVSIATTNLTYGFLAGFLVQGLLALVSKPRSGR
ncbi:MAG TPA: putative sulfate/molybdate transporter [Terriglobia bacterium]|nr:putative sulfate/molybdate transporter [Terriglobia bacterium]